jgi:methylthioribose-1-phosphate isomerase
MEEYYSIRWVGGVVRMLDQRLLPKEIKYLDFTQVDEVAEAIREMVIRGAPAIGAAAAYGLALAAKNSEAMNVEQFLIELINAADKLRASRPTAANLNWALDRILNRVGRLKTVDEIRGQVIREADQISKEDIEANRSMGKNALALIPDRANIIHHCNTGSLATVGYGTALGAIRAAHEHGKDIHVFVDETRPRLQGAKLTSWELEILGIPYTVIVDGASGFFMRQKKVDLCLVGCDRIASNGDVANKIGTYNLALVAYSHQVPFYVIGPTSTIDMDTTSGDEVPIEERPERELTHVEMCHITPDKVQVANPAFDVTPSKYVSAIVTEKGVINPPYDVNLHKIMSD